MTDYTKFIIEKFLSASNPLAAQPMAKYMKFNLKFLGITSTEREEIFKEARSIYKLPRFIESKQDIIDLWNMPEREFHYAAGDLLIRNRGQITPDYLPTFEWLITTNSWWDSVDTVVPKPLGTLLENHPELIKPTIINWAKSENIWLKRASLLFQLKYKQNLDTVLLQEIIEITKPTKEFFVQKAIGWILREYSKTNPEWVKSFIDKTQLSNLAQREGLKIIAKSR